MITVRLYSYFNFESLVQSVGGAAVNKGYFLLPSVIIVN